MVAIAKLFQWSVIFPTLTFHLLIPFPLFLHLFLSMLQSIHRDFLPGELWKNLIAHWKMIIITLSGLTMECKIEKFCSLNPFEWLWFFSLLLLDLNYILVLESRVFWLCRKVLYFKPIWMIVVLITSATGFELYINVGIQSFLIIFFLLVDYKLLFIIENCLIVSMRFWSY